jgi:hypothetical protein
MEKLTCPIWETKGIRKRGYREVCGQPAKEYLVQGQSYEVTAVLCSTHRTVGRKDGFRVVDIPVQDVRKVG